MSNRRRRRDAKNTNDVEDVEDDQFDVDALSDSDVSARLETAQLRREKLAIQLALLEVDQEVALLEKRTSRRSGMSSVASSPSSPGAAPIRVQYVARREGQQQPSRTLNRSSTDGLRILSGRMNRVEEVSANRSVSRHHTSSSHRLNYRSPERSRSPNRSSRRHQHHRNTSKASRSRRPRRSRRSRQREGYDSDSSADTLGSYDSFGSSDDEWVHGKDRRRTPAGRNGHNSRTSNGYNPRDGSGHFSRNDRRKKKQLRRERNATGSRSNASRQSKRNSELPTPPSPPPRVQEQQPQLVLPRTEQPSSEIDFELLSNPSTNTRQSLRVNMYRNPRTKRVESVLPKRTPSERIRLNDVDMKSVQRVRRRDDTLEPLPHEMVISWASDRLGPKKSETVKWVWDMLVRDVKVVATLMQQWTRVLLVQFAPDQVVEVWDRCVSMLSSF